MGTLHRTSQEGWFLWSISSGFLLNLLFWWPKFPWLGKQQLFFLKKGGWLLPQLTWIITLKSINMNLSPTPWKTFCDRLDFESLRYPRHSKVRYPTQLTTKKKILKIQNKFLKRTLQMTGWMKKHSLKRMKIDWSIFVFRIINLWLESCKLYRFEFSQWI